jgi:hypothetical protein
MAKHQEEARKPPESAGASVLKKFEEIYTVYLRALDSAWDSAQSAAETAGAQYAKEYQESLRRPDAEKQAEQALRGYVQKVRQLGMDLQKKYDDAYRSYLKAYQGALSTVDPGALDPATLATLGSSTTMAAHYAHITLDQPWATLAGRVDPYVLTLARTM